MSSSRQNSTSSAVSQAVPIGSSSATVWPAVQAGHDRGRPGQPGHRTAKAEVADALEVAVAVVSEHERHPVHHQRLDDAGHEALAETHHVEVGVQVAREPDQRPAVVVAIAIEHAVQRVLDRLAHRLRQQHDDRRGEQRHEPVVLVAVGREHEAHEAENREVENRARGQKRRVREAALDDHLDVPQAVANDGAGERDRHQAERHGRQLQRERRVGAERPRQRVTERERPDTKHGAPGDPPELPPAGQRRDLPERPRDDHERAGDAQEEEELLAAIERLERPGEGRAVGRAPADRDDAGDAKHDRRHVDHREQPRQRTWPLVRRPLREHEREVQQERRQERHRHGVSPVEDPVEPIERAVERERERTEEGDAEPEEVQRGLVRGPPEPDRGADEQGEEPDRRQHEVHGARPRSRRQRHLQRLTGTESNQRVAQRRAVAAALLVRDGLRRRLHQLAIDGQQNVAALDPGSCRRRPLGDLEDRHAFRPGAPQHAVLDLEHPGAHRDVGDAESKQRHHDRQGEEGADRRRPRAGLRRRWGHRCAGRPVASRARVRSGEAGVRHLAKIASRETQRDLAIRIP